MNAKKKRAKRIYVQGLMNGAERDRHDKELREEKFAKLKLQNKKLKRDLNNNPIW